MIAETVNELGDFTIAYNAINKVRHRAGLSPLKSLTQEQLRKAIRREYKWAFAGEGKRRFNLVRWGIGFQTAKKAVSKVYPLRAKSFKPQNKYLPIPIKEIEKILIYYHKIKVIRFCLVI